jgi:hypothetical protein
MKAVTIMPSPRFSTTLSLLAVLVSFQGVTLFAEDAVVQKFGDWTVTIQPGPRGSALPGEIAAAPENGAQRASETSEEVNANAVAQAETQVAAEGDLPVVIPRTNPNPAAMAGMYTQVYNQIPFSRAEYAANPSYRHDATMEFLFGKMRPTVIHRGSTARRNAPAMPAYYPAAYSPYGFNSFYYPFYYSYGGYPSYGWLQPASLW